VYGEPKVLHFDRRRQDFFGRSVHDEALPDPGYIVLQFDVGRTGNTANIRVAEDTLDNAAITGAAMQRVSSAIYRPRFENGRPVLTHDLRYRFDVRHGGKGLILGTGYPLPAAQP
jgi:hypothetical protein